MELGNYQLPKRAMQVNNNRRIKKVISELPKYFAMETNQKIKDQTKDPYPKTTQETLLKNVNENPKETSVIVICVLELYAKHQKILNG